MKETLTLKLSANKLDKEKILFGAKVLRDGGLVAFPTETVYGLGANFFNKKTITRLYRVKRRPKGKPFTVHIASADTIKKTGCVIGGEAKALIKKFWPGPLTIVLRSKSGRSVGFRMPDNEIALALIRKARVPIVTPSANISGAKPPTSAREVLKSLDGKIDILIDGGKTKIGIESTVVDLTVKPLKILREGAISRKQIFSALRS